VELVGALAIAAMIAAWMMVAGERARRTAMLGEDLSNLRQIATLTGQYAADNDDRFWTFSWQGGETYNSKWLELNFASDDMEAGANQAVVMLRDSFGRPDMPKIEGWFVHLSYSHIPLMLYAGRSLPTRLFVSSGDQPRRLWASDPEGFDQGKFGTNQPGKGGPYQRWPYSSSFRLSTSFYDQSATPQQRISQAGSDVGYTSPTGHDLRARLMASTSFPSQKIHLHDNYAWHFGTSTKHNQPTFPLAEGYAFFGDDDARLPLLFVDGHVAVHASKDSNPGWIPNEPTLCQPTTFASPSSGLSVPGRYRWTRGYLEGRDVGGPESPECQ